MSFYDSKTFFSRKEKNGLAWKNSGWVYGYSDPTLKKSGGSDHLEPPLCYAHDEYYKKKSPNLLPFTEAYETKGTFSIRPLMIVENFIFAWELMHFEDVNLVMFCYISSGYLFYIAELVKV